MAGTTPTRGYPFPNDTDAQDTAGHIQDLAYAVDSDVNYVATTASPALTAEIAARIAQDNAQQADYIARIAAVTVDGRIAMGPGYHQTNGISLQGSWSAVTLDGFGHAEIPFIVPFVIDPVVIVSGASSSNPQVSTTGLFTELPTTGSSFHVVAHAFDGGSLAGAILVLYWLAFGFIA